MTGPVLRAGAWPAAAGVSGVAAVVGGCGAAFPAAATVLLPICFALLAPLAAGGLVLLAAAMRGLVLPWTATALALAGNVLLGFAAEGRTGTRYQALTGIRGLHKMKERLR